MKDILAFGDSLTWGADPVTSLRHPLQYRWPLVLERGLGDGHRVYPDGLGGRTTMREDFSGPCSRNGVTSLQVALGVHMPLDLVIIMLGTNDLKPMHGGKAISAMAGMRRLVEVVETFPYKPRDATPKVLIVAPPHCSGGGDPLLTGHRDLDEYRKLSPLYQRVAAEKGCGFFDAATVCQGSAEDGIHLHAEDTAALGRALVAPVRALLG